MWFQPQYFQSVKPFSRVRLMNTSGWLPNNNLALNALDTSFNNRFLMKLHINILKCVINTNKLNISLLYCPMRQWATFWTFIDDIWNINYNQLSARTDGCTMCAPLRISWTRLKSNGERHWTQMHAWRVQLNQQPGRSPTRLADQLAIIERTADV